MWQRLSPMRAKRIVTVLTVVLITGIGGWIILSRGTIVRRSAKLGNDDTRIIEVFAPQPVGDRFTLNLIELGRITGAGFPLNPAFWQISDVCAGDSNLIFVADSGYGHVVVTDTNGEFHGTIGRRGSGPGEFSELTPLACEWLSNAGLLVVAEHYSLDLFGWDGDFSEAPVRFSEIFRLAPLTDSIGLMFNRFKPFRVVGIDGTWRTSPFGRPLSPEDTKWRSVSRAIDRISEFRDTDGTVRPSWERLPGAFCVMGDSVLLHDLKFRNGIRAWSIKSAEVLWELWNEGPDWPPPTLYRYKTSSTGRISTWHRSDPPMLHLNSRTVAMKGIGSYFVVVNVILGRSDRRSPERRSVTNPWTAANELSDGKSASAVVDIYSGLPEQIAHFTIPGVDKDLRADITSQGMLVISENTPTPVIRLFKIEGFPPVRSVMHN